MKEFYPRHPQFFKYAVMLSCVSFAFEIHVPNFKAGRRGSGIAILIFHSGRFKKDLKLKFLKAKYKNFSVRFFMQFG
jgi:hypothetical protein